MNYRVLAGMVVLAGFAVGCSDSGPDAGGTDQSDLAGSPPLVEEPAPLEPGLVPPPELVPDGTPQGPAAPAPAGAGSTPPAPGTPSQTPAGPAQPPAAQTPSAQTPSAQPPAAQTPPAQTPPAASGSRTVWDGVYTAAQARRGQQIAEAQCVLCHTLPDAWAPLLSQWVGPLDDPYVKMIETMPLSDPGSLQPAEYAAVMAYIIQLGGAPAGATEFPSRVQDVSQIRVTAR